MHYEKGTLKRNSLGELKEHSVAHAFGASGNLVYPVGRGYTFPVLEYIHKSDIITADDYVKSLQHFRYHPDLFIRPTPYDVLTPFMIEVKSCQQGITHEDSLVGLRKQVDAWTNYDFYKRKQVYVVLVEQYLGPNHSYPTFNVVHPDYLIDFLTDGESGRMPAVEFFRNMGIALDDQAVEEADLWIRTMVKAARDADQIIQRGVYGRAGKRD